MPASGPELGIHEWIEKSLLTPPVVKPYRVSAPVRASQGLMILADHRTPVQRNNRDGFPLRIGGGTYARGLCCDPHSYILVLLPANGRSFSATVGVDTNLTSTGAAVIFSVKKDGRDILVSAPVKRGEPGSQITVDLEGVKEFAISVDDAAYAVAGDRSDWAEAKVVLMDGGELWLDELPFLPRTFEAARESTPVFSFFYGGVTTDELLPGWAFRRSEQKIDENRNRWTISYADPLSGLEIQCEAIEYADFPAVDWVLTFRNNGKEDTPLLEDISALDGSFTFPGSDSFVVHYAEGSDQKASDYRPLSSALAPHGSLQLHSHGRPTSLGAPSGSPSVEALPFFNLQSSARGLIAGLGWSGPWETAVTRDDADTIFVRSAMDATHLVLHPGERIRSPRVVLLFWEGDRIQAQNQWRRLLGAYYSPKVQGPVADCNWGSWMPACDHIAEIRWWGDHRIPMECYWMDAGWSGDLEKGWIEHLSDRAPNKKLFPDGMRPVSDAAHQRGMKFLLWFVPHMAHPSVEIGAQHPEWLPQQSHGYYGLDHGNPAVNRFLIDYYSKIIDNYGIDIFRHDGTCFWPADSSWDRTGINQIRYIEGFYSFWDGLLERHPGLMIDNCGEGGRKLDLETLRRSVLLWRSDYQAGDFDPITSQAYTFGISSWIPLSGGAVPMSHPSVYAFRSAYCQAVLLAWPAGGLGRWESADCELIRRCLNEYLSMRRYFYGDFYPLTPYSLEQDVWMGWQFDRPDLAEGIIQAFRRPGSPAETARFNLSGLQRDAEYTLTNVDTARESVMRGIDLTERGITVQISERPGSALFIYKRGGLAPKESHRDEASKR